MDETEKPDGVAADSPAGVPSKKGRKKGALVLGVVVVVAAASAGVGSVYGPSIVTRFRHAREHRESVEKEEPAQTATLDQIVVDIRDAGGEAHHLRVGLALEISPIVKEEEFKPLVPRFRDAAISYFRARKLEEVTDPARLDAMRADLVERFGRAAGKVRVRRVLFTDFVVQ